MKKILYIILLFTFSFGFGQSPSSNHQDTSGEAQRISNIKHRLELLSLENSGLTENIETELSGNNITLANFLLAISNVHKVNINIAPELSQITIANNFTNVTVADLLVFLSKEYHLTIDFTGNILSIKRYQEPIQNPEDKVIPITYSPDNNTISMDIKGDKLYDVFKRVMDETRKNLVFSPGLENKVLTIYLQDTSFDAAMDKLAFANDLYLEKTKDGFYLFENNTTPVVTTPNKANAQTGQPVVRRRQSNFYFKVLNPEQKLLEVNFVNTPIVDIINDVGNALNIDVFTATPLDEAGTATLKTKSITFDDLLTGLFEAQTISSSKTPNPNSQNQNRNKSSSSTEKKFTFKKEGNLYFFGTDNQLSVRKVEVVHLMHRSIELLTDPQGGSSRVNRNTNTSSFGNTNNQFYNNNNNNRTPSNTNNRQNFSDYSSKAETLVNIVPDEVKQDLDIKIDYELNSFYVNGSSENIERFKRFIRKIDKPVPIVLIEVMIIEVSKTSTVETGVSWGIGDAPVNTQGGIFPETNITLGAKTINKVIGGFDGFGSFNLGKVVPNFFATIKAMEANGNLKIRSTPKISTLSGHRATFSNGQTSFYAVTQLNIIGSNNPQTNEITNYVPIDAELGITIKPLVSGDGQVTLDIFVIQSNFGQRIAEGAPPDINSREFSSIIRVNDQDIVVLGGLEEQMNNNSGSGVPLLARIPVIKYLFSKRKREAKKAKLTVLIKPTVFY